MSRLRARWLGRLPYAEAWDLQRAIHDGRASGRTADDYLLLLEHPTLLKRPVLEADSFMAVGFSERRFAEYWAKAHP